MKITPHTRPVSLHEMSQAIKGAAKEASAAVGQQLDSTLQLSNTQKGHSLPKVALDRPNIVTGEVIASEGIRWLIKDSSTGKVYNANYFGDAKLNTSLSEIKVGAKVQITFKGEGHTFGESPIIAVDPSKICVIKPKTPLKLTGTIERSEGTRWLVRNADGDKFVVNMFGNTKLQGSLKDLKPGAKIEVLYFREPSKTPGNVFPPTISASNIRMVK